MITLPFMDVNTKKGKYSAIIEFSFLEEPETEFGHYVSNGVGHISEDNPTGHLGFAYITKQVSIHLSMINNNDLHNNICGFENTEQLKEDLK